MIATRVVNGFVKMIQALVLGGSTADSTVSRRCNLATRGQHIYRVCGKQVIAQYGRFHQNWRINNLSDVFAVRCYLHLLCVRAGQVMQVVREQITRALAMKPSSLDQLKNKLRGLNYSEILRLRQSERMSQDDFQSPPIMLVRLNILRLHH